MTKTVKSILSYFLNYLFSIGGKICLIKISTHTHTHLHTQLTELQYKTTKHNLQ